MKIILQILKKAQITIFCTFVLCWCGCKKVLDVPLPANVVLVSSAFNDDGTATAAVLSMYSQMVQHNSFEWGGITINTSLYADDIHTSGLSASTNPFYIAGLTSAGNDAQTMMANAYSTILYVNTSIGQLLTSNSLTPSVKQQLLGECYFVRAYTYFYIVNFWGNAAALQLSTDIKSTQLAPSTPTGTIYKQIIADLKLAQANLNNTYVTTDRGRPNLQAANALLARVYLYTGQYTDAITQANAVIGSGLYTPLPSPAVNFLIGSSETIWSLQGQVIGGTVKPSPDGFAFNPTNTIVAPPYLLTASLQSAFEPGDLRFTNWVNAAAIGLTTPKTIYYVPGKYKQQSAANTAALKENYVMLRAAEMYMILAEAYYWNKDVPDAVTNLNIVRTRAGLPNLSASLTLDQCRAAIEQENRIEFFAEQGHRFLDLKRWPGIAGGKWRSDEVFPVTKAAVPTFTWATYKNLFPVADKDLQADKNLIQNPGY